MNDTDTYKGRVIVTYSRSLIALMIAQSLGSRGIDVIGCDDVKMTVLSFSKFVSATHVYAAPDKDEDAFIEDLLRIVRENKPQGDDMPYVLIPAFKEVKIIAKHADKFEGLIMIAGPTSESINAVDPKDHFAKTINDLGGDLKEASLTTWLPADEEDLNAHIEEMEFPVFIKPPDDVGGRGISKIENETALREAFADLRERYEGQQILIQQAAEGVDYCFCGLYEQGELKASMVYHNAQTFPNEAGPGVVRETVDDARFAVIANKLMGPVKWQGVVEIDFMWNGKEDSTPVMIEVNPRFWAGLDHSVKSDIEFPWLLYAITAGLDVEFPDQAKIGHKTSLPGLSAMSRVESLFGKAFNFEELERLWPEIKEHLKAHDLGKAASMFKEALDDTISLDEAVRSFKTMKQDAKEAENISYAEDDPFIGLGVLFVLGSLLKHGKLPPEITR